MDIITGLLRLFLHYRVRAIRRYAVEGDAIQMKMLLRIVKAARNTEWGKEHDYRSIRSYEDFAAKVPLGDYASHKPYISRMMEGAPDILWKGVVRNYAVSSVTTADAVKYIPLSKRNLRRSHLMGGRDVAATYLDRNRESHVAHGYSLILSGSLDSGKDTGPGKVGDISAHLAGSIPPLLRKMLHILPPAEISGISDVQDRFEAISELISGKKLVSFSGVPTWSIMLLGMAVQKAGARTAEELWPRMEFFAHGGMSLLPYRKKLEALFPSGKLRFIENYNASEGFFGVQTDPDDPAMTLMLDYENFYEFVPMSSYGRPDARALPVWEVEPGVEYALLVSTSSGLWRYDMGDVLRFTRIKPYKFVIVGRTHQNINIFGEDLSAQQAEKALEAACRKSGVAVKEFTVAPDFDFMERDGVKGRHEWLVEFEKEPANLEEFAQVLDKAVQEEGFDYKQAIVNREGSTLIVRRARPGLFYDWLNTKGKLGGQHKIPRLCPGRKYMDELLAMNGPVEE